jgi:hypothetical protein
LLIKFGKGVAFLNKESFFKRKEKKELTIEEGRRLFYLFLFSIAFLVYLLAGPLNFVFDNLTSQLNNLFSDLNIPKTSVLIAPIVEESLKMFGYSILFLLPVKFSKRLGYDSKAQFIKEYILTAFLLSAGIFGIFEGLGKNILFCPACIPSFIILQSLVHITYSIYPFILGIKYRNCFVCFLPIAIILHAVHNFIIGVYYDNKWVTFSMVMIFLMPFIILERKQISSFCNKNIKSFCNFLKKTCFKKHILLIISILVLIYIFLCCLLAFG